jgi:hypothetical protein
MPDALDGIIQRMYDAGESEDDIAAVIKDYKKNPPRPVQESIAEPDTFFGGVSKSLFSGEALKAGLEGALGFGKGALLNLPSTIATGVGDALEVATSPIRTARNAPEAFRAIPDVARGMWDTATRAGSDPFAFGEMIGELTGQPLATAGIAKGAPYTST